MNFVQPIRDLKQLEALKKVLRDGSDRNYMLLVTGINTGLRISDLLRLRVCDVHGKRIVLREKKTKKQARPLINPTLRKELNRYTKGKDGRVYLFGSRVGVNQPLTRSGAYKLLRKAAASVGLHELGTHTLRKTFGYHMYKKTKDVAELQELFNHSHPSTTLRYIGVNQDSLDQAMKEFGL